MGEMTGGCEAGWEWIEAVESIRAGIAAAQGGDIRPAREALAKLRERLGISGRYRGSACRGKRNAVGPR